MTQATSVTFDEPAGEYPPRYWWLKRISGTGAIVLVLLVVAQVWWAHVAHVRLERAVAQLHSAGSPANVDDLQPADLPDADNAAFFLKRAATKLNPKIDSPSTSNYTWNANRFPYPAKWWAIESAAAAVDQPAFADLREARKHPKAKWVTLSSPLANVLLPHLNIARELAFHAADYAMFLHFDGKDADAMEMLFDVMHQSKSLDQEPFIISNLVAGGLRVLVSVRVQMIAPDLSIAGSSPTTRPFDRQASRQQVMKMIALLLDQSPRTERAPHSIATERVVQMDFVLNKAKSEFVLQPMLLLDAAHAGNSPSIMETAVQAPDLPAALAMLNGPKSPQNPVRIVSRAVIYTKLSAIQGNFRAEEECTAAAISLAIRLYRIDHEGLLPPKLDALVPAYLPKVPADPLAPGAKAMKYVILNNGARAIVYSVGMDQTDDSAGGAAIPNQPFYGWDPTGMTKDEYHDLLRWSPPPTTAPAESNETADD